MGNPTPINAKTTKFRERLIGLHDKFLPIIARRTGRTPVRLEEFLTLSL